MVRYEILTNPNMIVTFLSILVAFGLFAHYPVVVYAIAPPGSSRVNSTLLFHELDSIVMQEPGNVGALIARGEAAELFEENHAIDWYEKALVISPTNTTALMNKGMELHELTRDIDAVQTFDKLLSIEPNNTRALIEKGRSLVAAEKYTGAVNTFDKLLSIEPNNTRALIEKASVMENQGLFNESMQLYDKVLALAPQPNSDTIDAWMRKGHLLTELGKFDEALVVYKNVQAVDFDYPLVQVAEVLEKLGRGGEAKSLLEQMKDGGPISILDSSYEWWDKPFANKKFIETYVCTTHTLASLSEYCDDK